MAVCSFGHEVEHVCPPDVWPFQLEKKFDGLDDSRSVRSDRRRKMPKKEVIQVNLAAANPNLSPATRFGNLVFVAGQTGRHPVSGEVGKGVREQTNYALQRVNTILAAAGTSLDNVLSVTTHLTKREDLAAYNEEYAKFFPTNKPARTTVEVMLNSPDLLVEITVTACIPD
jgi:2-iminobutanoate/2-iminopropanoate deaminase